MGPPTSRRVGSPRHPPTSRRIYRGALEILLQVGLFTGIDVLRTKPPGAKRERSLRSGPPRREKKEGRKKERKKEGRKKEREEEGRKKERKRGRRKEERKRGRRKEGRRKGKGKIKFQAGVVLFCKTKKK